MRQLAKLSLVIALVACGKDSKTTGGQDAPSSTDDSNNGSNTIDAPGPDAATAGVTCGTMTCATGMECCTTFANMTASYACIAAGGQCQGGVTQACDGPEDCTNGDACCASFGGGTGSGAGSGSGSGTAGGSVACGATGQGCFELCHTPADCSQTGAMCCTSQFFSSQYCAMQCF